MAHQIAVVIPVYSHAELLPEAVRSVLSQEGVGEIEIVVVDDGSPANVPPLLTSFGERVKLVRQVNQGLGAARNTGIQNTQAPYILFLDCDDIILPGTLAALHKTAVAKPGTIPMAGFIIEELQSKKELHREDKIVGELVRLPDMFDRNYWPIHCYLFSRELLNKLGGFDPKLPSCEDWDFLFRAAFSGARWEAIPHVGAVYRKHAQVMTADPALMFEGTCRLLANLHRQFMERPELVVKWGVQLAHKQRAAFRKMVARKKMDRANLLFRDLSELTSHPGFPQDRSFRMHYLVTEHLFMTYLKFFNHRRYSEFL